MYLNTLLDVSEKTTNIVKWVSVSTVAALVILFAILAVICVKGKKTYDAKHIAFAGISLGLAFALSFLKVSPVNNGGSITLASFVPVLIYAYVYGVTDGLLVGLIFGLLNFVSSPWILTPMTFILDFLLAFASIGVMGLARKFTKKTTFNVVLGTIAVFAVRFVFHLVSGMIYFAQNAIWAELPAWALENAFVYSFIYQCVYLPADCAIAVVVLYALAKSKVVEKLAALMRPRRAKSVPAAEASVSEDGKAA